MKKLKLHREYDAGGCNVALFTPSARNGFPGIAPATSSSGACSVFTAGAVRTIFLLLFFFLSFVCSIQAQSLAPQVVGVAGGQASVGQMSVTWTIGQTAVDQVRFTQGKGSLTEGFHQPYLMVDPLRMSSIFQAELLPNPVQSTLTLRMPFGRTKALQARLIDAQGRILKSIAEIPGGDTRIRMDDLPAGVYFLQVFSESRPSEMESYKVIKLRR